MTISLKHTFASAKSDGTDSTLVQPSNWNAEHTITLAAGKVLGRDTSAAGAMQELPLAFDSSGNATVSATGSFTPPVGTTGQRPATPATGMMRYNTSTTAFEGYNGSAWGNLIPASAAVASISFGSTGLTPNTATTGAVSVAGTLAVANGGTGLASAGALGNVLTSDGTNWTSSASSGGGSSTGSYMLSPQTSQSVTTAASGNATSATIYFSPSYLIPVGSLVNISGMTPSGYNGSLMAVTASSQTSFSCTGSISGTTLTVSSITGTVTIGAVITGGNILQGTYITAGSGTSWTINQTQTVASTTVAGSCGVITFANTTTGALTVAGSMAVVPLGYLPCNGSVYNRASYPALAGYIGTPLSPSPAVVSSSTIIGGSYSGLATVNGYAVSTKYGVTTVPGNNIAAAAAQYVYSSDGINWSNGTGWPILGIMAYNNGIYGRPLYSQSPNQSIASIGYGSSISNISTRGDIATIAGSTGGATVSSLTAGGTGNVFLATTFGYPVRDCCSNIISGYVSAGVYTSTTGASGSWSSPTLPGFSTTIQYQVLSAGGPAGIVIMQVSASKVWASTTGTGTYVDISSTFSGTLLSLSFANNQFILTTSTSLYVSQSGATGTWVLVKTFAPPDQVGWNSTDGIKWTGQFYVNRSVMSVDLKNWVLVPTSATYNSWAIAIAGTKVVATNFNTLISWGPNSYSATQFPTPTVAAPTVTGFGSSGVTPIGYYIKT